MLEKRDEKHTKLSMIMMFPAGFLRFRIERDSPLHRGVKTGIQLFDDATSTYYCHDKLVHFLRFFFRLTISQLDSKGLIGCWEMQTVT